MHTRFLRLLMLVMMLIGGRLQSQTDADSHQRSTQQGLELLHQANEVAQAIKDSSSQIELTCHIAFALASAGDQSDAIATFQRALGIAARSMPIEARISQLNYIAALQLMVGDRSASIASLRLSFESAGTITQAARRDSELADLVRYRAKAGDVAGARQTVAEIASPSRKDYALGEMIVNVLPTRDLTAALEMASGMQNAELKIDALQKIATAQAKGGDFAGSLGTLRQGLTLAAKVARVEGKIQALREIAVLQKGSGDHRSAIDTMQQAVQIADTPHLKARALIDLAAAEREAGHWTKAVLLLRRASQAAAGMKDVSNQAPTLASIASEQARAGDRETAAMTFRAAIAIAAKDTTLGPEAMEPIAKAEGEVMDLESCLQTASSIPNPADRSIYLHYIATAQARTGDLEGALRTESKISDAYAKQQAYEDIADAQIKAGDTEGAIRTSDHISHAFFKFVVLVDAGAAEANAGQVDRANETFRKALTAGLTVEEFARDRVLTHLTQSFADLGDAEGALQAASAIQDPSTKSDALRVVAETQAKKGDGVGALKTIDQCVRLVGANGGHASPQRLRELAWSQTRIGNLAGVLNWSKDQNLCGKGYALLGAAEGMLGIAERTTGVSACKE